MPIDRGETTSEPSAKAWEFPPGQPTDPLAVSAGAKLLSEIAKNEETRFSNLNTRAAAVLSAVSVVTGILGITSKNVLDGSLEGVDHLVAILGLVATLALLVATAYLLVFNVLKPKARYVFGDNELTNADTMPGLSVAEIECIAFREYGQIYASLAARSTLKAKALNQAYMVFFFALAVGATAVALVVILASVGEA